MRTLLFVTLTALLTLTACNKEAVDVKQDTISSIPSGTLIDFDPYSPSNETLSQWTPNPFEINGTLGKGEVVLEERKLPTCDNKGAAWTYHITGDASVVDFEWSLYRQENYIQANQLTLYPDEETAQLFQQDFTSTYEECKYIDNKLVAADYEEPLKPLPKNLVEKLGVEDLENAHYIEGKATAHASKATTYCWVTLFGNYYNLGVIIHLLDTTCDTTPRLENKKFLKTLTEQANIVTDAVTNLEINSVP